MINVTQSYLPPLSEYVQYLEKIWDNCWLTNNGPLVIELEENLSNFLGVEHLLFLNNGTIALQIAIKALQLKGEVITTPFSYVATTTAILWENCKPVFVDIDPDTYCIDASKIEAAITSDTSAILATHVYGLPCDVEAIEVIAKKYNLKVIYDGAHAFGVEYKNQSLLNYGDISTLSFHATKLFHTVEGGAVVTNNEEIAKQMSLYRSFGHIRDDYYTIGVNGKNSEFHAAMGLCNLPKVPELIQKRKIICDYYDEQLVVNTHLERPKIPQKTIYNYSYYPILFGSEEELVSIMKELLRNNINPRRYFYPSLNTLSYLSKQVACPVSESIAPRILCLPLYPDLEMKDAERICQIIKEFHSIYEL
ncbi:MAG: DegT/DnrJ/EryC1/StrS family aminotransferase [Chitinophagales bacterium]